MKHYFLQSRKQGRKTILIVLPDQKGHDGLTLYASDTEDADGISSQYPEGTVFGSTSLVTRRKGHASWYETRGVKVLSASPIEAQHAPDETMLRKWEAYRSTHEPEL